MKPIMRLTLRTKIAVSFAGVILATGLVATITGIHLLGSGIIREAQTRIRLNLNSAHEIYQERLRYIETVLEFTALRSKLKTLLVSKSKKSIAEILTEVRRNSGIELINITDPEGKVIVRASNPESSGDDVSSNPVVGAVLKSGMKRASTELIGYKEISKESQEISSRVRIEILPTPKSGEPEMGFVGDGMMLMAGVPLKDGEKILGVLYGGELLNNNNTLVDKIKDVIFKNEKYKGMDLGTATIFQDDVRISTNVLDNSGKRAIGTRVSEAVREKVLDKGQGWSDEAFVVHDWYITAYEPIKNIQGRVIGMLYVGILKRPFNETKIRVVALFLLIGIVGIFIVFLVSTFLAGRISRPLRKIRDIAKQIAAGDYTREIKVKSGDVVGELAVSLNTMTKKLIGAQEELQQWVKTLEDRVEERTAKLKEIQKELIQVEKMASVGRLAAGVAHEINNPLTGILTNASLLMEEFPEDSSKYDDLKTIVNETIRCRKIVKDLLDFSRQTQPEQRKMGLNEIIDSTCELVWNQVSFKNIIIKKDLDRNLPGVLIDRDQITQVFMNILLNACDAMPKGGDIVIRSGLSQDGKFVEISFKDTGPGIDKDHIDQLFDPFFSTKKQGTGLGLAISYGIVQQHGGVILVNSEKGQGATFIVRLPVSAS